MIRSDPNITATEIKIKLSTRSMELLRKLIDRSILKMSDSETSAQGEGDTLPPLPSETVKLQVGERQYPTTVGTLTRESCFFQALFSGNRDNKQSDGSYFIDADPELFQHILQYLRRGILPLVYDVTSGHNHCFYLRMLGEAKYFQISRLKIWLQNKEYLHAVKIKHSITQVESTEWEEVGNADEQLKFHQVWEVRKVYVCPRGIVDHMGNLNACGRQCRTARDGTGWIWQDEAKLKTVVVKKQSTVDLDALVDYRIVEDYLTVNSNEE
jgi:hypothetical protein